MGIFGRIVCLLVEVCISMFYRSMLLGRGERSYDPETVQINIP